jgi:hypothetical protein
MSKPNEGPMKKLALSLFPFVFLLGSAHAQEQSGEIQSDISGEVSSLELPPVKLDVSLGYQSNIDLLDPNNYVIKHKENTIINLGGSTKINSELGGNQLSFSTSLKAIVLQDSDYDKSSDVLRRVNFNNRLFLNLLSGNDRLSFGPTLDMNAEKRFTHPGFHRKRDNINGAIGLKADLKASSDLMVSSAASVGYLDHNGNYTDPNNPNRAFEKDFQEDRAIYKASITSVFKANSNLTISMPISYQRDNFTQRRARAAKMGYSAIDRDLAGWAAANGQAPMDEALDMQNIAAGLNTDITMGMVVANLGYTFLDDREMNLGHGRNNADTDNYEMSLSTDISESNLALSYSNENIHYNYLLGGATEITQSYSANITTSKILKDISTNLKVSYTDYQFSSPNINYAEKANDIVAMVGISTTL